MKYIMMSMVLLIATMIQAQDITTQQTSTNPLTISGYAEGYYSYDFNKPSNNTRPSFLYSYNRPQ